ncbi:hypothetical protein B0T17DRAFT_541936, partial [Bombardia bombarda]
MGPLPSTFQQLACINAKAGTAPRCVLPSVPAECRSTSRAPWQYLVANTTSQLTPWL